MKAKKTILGLALLVIATGILLGCSSLNGEASFQVTVDPEKRFKVIRTDVELSNGDTVSYTDCWVYAKIENTSKAALFNSEMTIEFNTTNKLLPSSAEAVSNGEGGVEIANDEGSVFFSVFEPSGVTYDVGRNKGATSKHVSDLSIGESEECYLYLPGYEDNEPVSYSRATKMAGVCLGNYVFSDLFGGDTVYACFDEYVYPEE